MRVMEGRGRHDLVGALREYEARRIARTSTFMRIAKGFDAGGAQRAPWAVWARDNIIRLQFSAPLLTRSEYYRELTRLVV